MSDKPDAKTCKHCGQSYTYQHTCKGGKGDSDLAVDALDAPTSAR